MCKLSGVEGRACEEKRVEEQLRAGVERNQREKESQSLLHHARESFLTWSLAVLGPPATDPSLHSDARIWSKVSVGVGGSSCLQHILRGSNQQPHCCRCASWAEPLYCTVCHRARPGGGVAHRRFRGRSASFARRPEPCRDNLPPSPSETLLEAHQRHLSRG